MVVNFTPLSVRPISQAHRGASDERPISLSDDSRKGFVALMQILYSPLGFFRSIA